MGSVSDVSGELHIVSVNLKTTPGYYVVDLAHQHIDASGCCDCACECDTSGTAPILNGFVQYAETLPGSPASGDNLVTIANGAVDGVTVTPLIPADGIQTLTDDGVRYWITGNRIWFIIQTASTKLTSTVEVNLSFQVIERLLPTNLSEYSNMVLSTY
jgi:hypothetical protein